MKIFLFFHKIIYRIGIFWRQAVIFLCVYEACLPVVFVGSLESSLSEVANDSCNDGIVFSDAEKGEKPQVCVSTPS